MFPVFSILDRPSIRETDRAKPLNPKNFVWANTKGLSYHPPHLHTGSAFPAGLLLPICVLPAVRHEATSMLNDVTFGITAFERPMHLEQLVSSILVRYPDARIIVADNGKQKASLPKQVKVIHLPFDAGVSRARNALVDALETKYLLILEEDFLFTRETQIERLVEILECDEELGVVGGALRSRNGRVSAYSLDIEIFRETFYVRESTHRVRITSSGIPYRICDVIWNFALFRAEMLRRHRWDDRLKVGEHAPYFHQVKLAAEWRVACCPSVILYHVPDSRTREYQNHRQRAQKLFRDYLARYNLSKYCRIPPMKFIDDLELKPCVVVMGVGHSGTSILAKMLHAAGWEPGDADRPYGESLSIRDLNIQIQKTGEFPDQTAQKLLTQLPRPWAIKDPRFVMTLHHWLPVFSELERPPVLVRIVRDPRDVEASYHRRNVRGDIRAMVQQRIEMCQNQYENWPWMRMTIQYEQLGRAAALFDFDRMAGSKTESLPKSGPTPAAGIGGVQRDSQAELLRDSQAAEFLRGSQAAELLWDSEAFPVRRGAPDEDSHIDWFAADSLLPGHFSHLRGIPDSHALDEDRKLDHPDSLG